MKIKQPSAQAKPTVISICELKKVYCSNCKYYLANEGFAPRSGYQPQEHQCWHINNFKEIDNPIEIEVKMKTSANKINKNNDCSWYKRKWYKFWAK